jgi:hypothetical protein
MAVTPDPRAPLEPEGRPERSSPGYEPEPSSTTFYSDLSPDPTNGGRKKKPKRWITPSVVTVCAVVMLGLAGLFHYSAAPSHSPEQIVSYSGADFDQAETQKVIDEIKTGASEPLLALLTPQMKQELLSGERKFYKLPLESPVTPAAPAPDAGQTPSGDRVSVALNGTPYGQFALSQQPITFDLPLKIGDQLSITCISVATGKTTVQVAVATGVSPVETAPLAQWETETFIVHTGASGQNYDWFEQQAQQGNPVAQYGLGHMYRYGIGVQQDTGQAIHWYQLAAAQNYLDAQAQLNQLSSP